MSVAGEWRPDPTGRFGWRWWDGEWRDSVSVADGVATDPYPFIIHGSDPLDVVGESYRQDAILRVTGTTQEQAVHDHRVVAYLHPEPDNPHDANAVAVVVAGQHVGYLPRTLAATVHPVVEALDRQVGSPIALMGVITGGGRGPDGELRNLGVFLTCDVTTLGLRPQPRRSGAPDTGMGTAMSDGGFGWLESVPNGHVEAIRRLRVLLGEVDRPIERHFIHLELVKRLYKVRDDFDSALTEFDVACEAHHGEMDRIRPALLEMVEGRIPRISTYSQAAIRHTKAKDFGTAFEWAMRGLDVYGDDAHDPAVPEDLEKRAGTYRDKLKRSPSRRRSVTS